MSSSSAVAAVAVDTRPLIMAVAVAVAGHLKRPAFFLRQAVTPSRLALAALLVVVPAPATTDSPVDLVLLQETTLPVAVVGLATKAI